MKENIFDMIAKDEEKQAQDVIHRILGGPETDPDVILLGCGAAIQSIVIEMENPKMEIESFCKDLLSSTIKRIQKGI